MLVTSQTIKKLLEEELKKLVTEAIQPISPISRIPPSGDFSGSSKDEQEPKDQSGDFEKMLQKAIENEKAGRKEEAATLLKGAARYLQGIEEAVDPFASKETSVLSNHIKLRRNVNVVIDGITKLIQMYPSEKEKILMELRKVIDSHLV
jgi:hypothetical protein